MCADYPPPSPPPPPPLCPKGTHQNSNGGTIETGCTDCETGKYQDSDDYGGDSCIACDAGYYQVATGQSACTACVGPVHDGTTVTCMPTVTSCNAVTGDQAAGNS